MFGVLAAPGGIELNTKELALAFGIGALVFWAVVSYFSGAGALGAFVAFGALVYCWLWIPNRTTNFLNDVPGVTTGMIDGSKQYTVNGVVPILGVISLVYAIQLIVHGVQRRRRERAESDRLQREQEAAQAQQEADVAAVYPVAGSTYAEAPAYESHSRYDDLFDEPEPVQPRNQADEQTRQFPVGADEFEHTRQFPEADAPGNYPGEETVVAPVPQAHDDESPAAEPEAPQAQEPAAEQEFKGEQEPAAQQEAPAQEEPAAPEAPAQQEPAAQEAPAAEAKPVEETQAMPVEQTKPAEDTQAMPVEQPEPVEQTQPMPVSRAEPAEQTKPVETKPAETKPVETKPAGNTPSAPKSEARVVPKEQMGSRYRERMEDPEDTGEFHLAFENPVVKPA